MGWLSTAHNRMKTTFSQLENWKKEFIAETVAYELLTQINRNVSVTELCSIFEVFDVDVHVTSEQTFTIQKNDKLRCAVQQISARF